MDEAALAACLAYVDFNPIRAGIAETSETSQFTSVYERIQGLREVGEISDKATDGLNAVAVCAELKTDATVGPGDDGNNGDRSDQGHQSAVSAREAIRGAWLSRMELSEDPADDSVTCGRASNTGCLPMSLAEYLDLLDWTGRQLRSDKRGAIVADQPPILERLKICPTNWMKLIRKFSGLFQRAAGTPASILREGEKRGCRRMQGIQHSRELFA